MSKEKFISAERTNSVCESEKTCFHRKSIVSSPKTISKVNPTLKASQNLYGLTGFPISKAVEIHRELGNRGNLGPCERYLGLP